MSRNFGPCGEIIVSGGGGRVVQSITIGDQVAAGASGELFNVDPGSLNRVVITGLAVNGASEADIEIKFGTRVVYTGGITETPNANSLTVMQGYPASITNEYTGVGTVSSIAGDVGEVLSVSKTTGNTANTVLLSYMITD